MEPARLRQLVEVAILCALAPDDTTRRAYLRNRWHGRPMGSDARSQPGRK